MTAGGFSTRWFGIGDQGRDEPSRVVVADRDPVEV
jgi:hypothetical protein